MLKDPDDWEQQLKEEGLSARRDKDWGNYPRISLQAMKFHDAALAHHDCYSWEGTGDPFQKLKAAAPPEIRRIADLDHRRRTRKEQAKLTQWVEEEGMALAKRLGLRRK